MPSGGSAPCRCSSISSRDTFNIDPALIAERITSATKAIIPVHLFGQCADMDGNSDGRRPHKIADHRRRRPRRSARLAAIARAGALGEIGCFSFYPTKNLGAFGDGGMLTTDDDDLAAQLRLLRAHGMEPRYYHKVVGINSRLDSIQAAVLNVKLPHLNRWAQLRRANAEFYTELMTECGLDRILTLPTVVPGRRHVWNQYVIRVPNGRRDALRTHLTAAKIGTEIYYPVHAARTGMLPLARLSAGKLAGIGASRPRSAGAADLPGTAGRGAASGRDADRRILRHGEADLTGQRQAAEISRSPSGIASREARLTWNFVLPRQSSSKSVCRTSLFRLGERQTIVNPRAIAKTTSVYGTTQLFPVSTGAACGAAAINGIAVTDQTRATTSAIRRDASMRASIVITSILSRPALTRKAIGRTRR